MTSPDYDATILDLDGTVYLGDNLIDGAETTVRTLRAAGIEVMFLTNKAIARRRDYAEKLTHLGIPATTDQVINSGWVTARYIKDHYPDQCAFVIGEDPLVEEFASVGIPTTTEASGDLLVASMDREFTYRKLELALDTMDEQTPFLATNPDRTCPTQNGAIPDAAAMIGAVEGLSGQTVDEVLGKPSAWMLEFVLDKLDVGPEDCLMVGDRLETDIEMGARAGMDTALVLTGVTERSAVTNSPVSPDYVLESIGELETIIET